MLLPAGRHDILINVLTSSADASRKNADNRDTTADNNSIRVDAMGTMASGDLIVTEMSAQASAVTRAGLPHSGCSCARPAWLVNRYATACRPQYSSSTADNAAMDAGFSATLISSVADRNGPSSGANVSGSSTTASADPGVAGIFNGDNATDLLGDAEDRADATAGDAGSTGFGSS